jgi:hypothetical protein
MILISGVLYTRLGIVGIWYRLIWKFNFNLANLKIKEFVARNLMSPVPGNCTTILIAVTKLPQITQNELKFVILMPFV